MTNDEANIILHYMARRLGAGSPNSDISVPSLVGTAMAFALTLAMEHPEYARALQQGWANTNDQEVDDESMNLIRRHLDDIIGRYPLEAR